MMEMYTTVSFLVLDKHLKHHSLFHLFVHSVLRVDTACRSPVMVQETTYDVISFVGDVFQSFLCCAVKGNHPLITCSLLIVEV